MKKDKEVIATVRTEGRCLLGDSAHLYRKDGALKKLYQDQLERLGLVTVKVVAERSYNIHVYAVRPDYVFKEVLQTDLAA